MPEPCATIAVSYRREWPDGFGARGWKLDTAIGDPEVIAATAETGRRLPTSVLVHDILDHHLCGLPLSGHRNEAKALQQLASRTGMDSLPDLLQMVDEDIIHGRVIGESLAAFLPADLLALLPDGMATETGIAHHLREALGRDALRQRLADHLRAIGIEAEPEMEAVYRAGGLDHGRRRELGLALQHLLTEVDALALAEDWESGRGVFLLAPDRCALAIDSPRRLRRETPYPLPRLSSAQGEDPAD